MNARAQTKSPVLVELDALLAKHAVDKESDKGHATWECDPYTANDGTHVLSAGVMVSRGPATWVRFTGQHREREKLERAVLGAMKFLLGGAT